MAGVSVPVDRLLPFLGFTMKATLTALMRACGIAGVAVATCTLAGCRPAGRPNPPRTTVTGTVTLDGQPILKGEVLFLALSGESADALPLLNGVFAGSVTVGEHRVQCASYITVKREVFPDQPPQDVLENSLPARFHSESTLTAVVRSGSNPPLLFELKSEPPKAPQPPKPVQQ